MLKLPICHDTEDTWRLSMSPVVVLWLLVLLDKAGMVEVRGSPWALTGTWGLMAAEQLLEELCHFTARVTEESS